jgi:hypothetical protein
MVAVSKFAETYVLSLIGGSLRLERGAASDHAHIRLRHDEVHEQSDHNTRIKVIAAYNEGLPVQRRIN